MEGLGLQETSRIEDATFLLVTGVASPDEPPEDFDALGAYDEILAEARERDLILVCANSDRIAISGGKSYFCGGAVASRYALLGGECFHYGKPHPIIYDACFSILPSIAKDRIAAIGDSFETDMPGGRDANIDTVFIAGGIHAATLEDNASDGFAKLCADTQCQPRAAMDLLRW